MDMLEKLNDIKQFIGDTPLKKLRLDGCNLYVKLEYCNLTGSSKDRAAYSVLRHGIETGRINAGTLVVCSSSGNFAIAAASICNFLGLRFIPVIDPIINPQYEKQLRLLSHQVVKVTRPDETGGYLLTRIETVKSICAANENSFYADQYEDPYNYWGYYNTLGAEICRSFDTLDYVFVAVSSGGTITGLSRKLKEKFPRICVVAVDVEGSVIFSPRAAPRSISGIGASRVPPILREALIDRVMHVSQPDLVKGCHELLNEQTVFGGGSAGAVYAAIKSHLRTAATTGTPNVLFICPDRGNAYLETIYNPQWAKTLEDTLTAWEAAHGNDHTYADKPSEVNALS